MKRFFTISLLSLLFIPTLSAEEVLRGFAAWNDIEGATVVRYKDFSGIPAYIKFHPEHRMAVSDWQTWMDNQYFKQHSEAGFELVTQESDRLGMVHYRYHQTWNGKEVQFGNWIVHTLNGEVVSMNGELFESMPNVSASLSESAALDFALNSINATTYKWEVEEEQMMLQLETGNTTATFYPEGELVYVNSDASLKTSDLHLTWKFNIYAAEPLSRTEVFVDATDGSIVFEQNLIHHADSNGVAVTGYSGTQNIVADYTGTNFRLRETGRGNGVETYNMNNGTNHGAATDFFDNDNLWNATNVDAYAGDAHWGAEMTYDYFWLDHNRNSINNNGFTLRSYIHYGTNYGNAFWDGQRMTYGDGSNGNSPFTAIDIAGHEIAHGLTTFTAGLIYQNESGALNESFSDIFGAAVEFFALGFNNGDWLMGEDLGFVIRNMANPAQYNDPDTYGAGLWYTGTQDNGGVHINSGVQNFWFYLLTVGGAGTNDLGNAYNVTSIGVDDAAAVAFRNLTVYLTQSSQYTDARFYALESAEDLFGVCSQQLISTGKAWYAVGVGNDYSPTVQADFTNSEPGNCQVPHTVDFFDQSSNASNYTWVFGDGNTSTQANPSHTYTTPGTYTVQLTVSSTCGNDNTSEVDLVVVGPDAPCIVTMPSSGVGTTQQDCSGILYDDGGSIGNYSANSNSVITIAPNTSTTITLDILEFDMEDGPGCGYDFLAIYDGPNTSSTQIGTYCNGNLPPAVITSSGTSITIQQFADGGVEESGFKIQWTCNDPTTPPNADFETANIESCDGVVYFEDLSVNAANQWSWDFGDGNSSTSQNPTHTYALDGQYTVTMVATNIIGSDTVVKSNYVDVDRPDGPVGNNVDICPGDIVELIATSNGTQYWYDSPVGGSALYQGDSFLVGIVNTTTPYYVESVENNPAQAVGAFDASIGPGANFNTSNQYLIFDAFKSITIESVKVFASGAGPRTIVVLDSSGIVVDSVVVNMAGGEEVVALNLNIPSGNEYQIGLSPSSAVNLYRNTSGAQYPYELSGIMSIKRSTANTNPFGYYYFFYEWNVSDQCVSERTELVASVAECLGVSELTAQSMRVFPNPNNGQFTVSWEGDAVETIELMNMAGQLVMQEAANGRTQVTVTESLPSGIYSLRAITRDGMVKKQVVIQ